MPALQHALDTRYKDEAVEALGISTGDPLFYLVALRKEYGIRFPMLQMDISDDAYARAIHRQYKLETHEGPPTLLVLDRSGVIKFRESSYEGVGCVGQGNTCSVFNSIDFLLELTVQLQP